MKSLTTQLVVTLFFLFAGGKGFCSPTLVEPGDDVNINVVILINDLILNSDPPVFSREAWNTDGAKVVIKTDQWKYILKYDAIRVSPDATLIITVQPLGLGGIWSSESFTDIGINGRADSGNQANYRQAIRDLGAYRNSVGLD